MSFAIFYAKLLLEGSFKTSRINEDAISQSFKADKCAILSWCKFPTSAKQFFYMSWVTALPSNSKQSFLESKSWVGWNWTLLYRLPPWTLLLEVITKSFYKIVQAVWGQTWDLFFVYFLSSMQRLRPLGCCAPCSKKKFPTFFLDAELNGLTEMGKWLPAKAPIQLVHLEVAAAVQPSQLD